ncbi:hypothetical protein Pedsa_0892 [Pseudopedobacter saltans DSM 12145]|uniref:Zinc finger CHC2-type domain-containing protein n=1 Tax=Pseudopedobacter saltans (strain ATCC 51119 / DSM 12145 / JCM 21818 / CCUG 39354 / LMG 10337 / NBRC 100064 / NCIMB 13643) TaxID=762903 RepID=F0SA87_PSESL|nr:DUF6371 domain-containing protein [Pseudopedobacter saltans]ADY51464.1 hypothetical protein Pedsa_0892 [Pseudopedobacter saltans DSM 12145]
MQSSQLKFIKEKADILQVVKSLIPLTAKGYGKCPFHTEKSGSLKVESKKGIFKCFGCGASGDVIDFVMKYKSITYKEAFTWIADFYRIGDFKDQAKDFVPEPAKELPVSLIPKNIFIRSIRHYFHNNFYEWLNRHFAPESCFHAANQYFIGSSKHWNNATVFWQVDCDLSIRSGKIMLYNPETGKRIKEPYNHINWVHKVLDLPDFNLKQCFFGEHLLNGNNKMVCIVESEKTAIVASIVYPDQVWLASGSLVNLTAERCEVLKGREVILFPDVGAFPAWEEKAEYLNQVMPDTHFAVDQSLANYTQKGFDLCDYIIDNLNHFK